MSLIVGHLQYIKTSVMGRESFAVRKTTNIHPKKRGCLLATTIFLLLGTSAEQSAEQFTSQLPIVAVDAVPYFRSLHLALYQSSILQFLQMLRNGGLGNGQFLVNIPKVAMRLP